MTLCVFAHRINAVLPGAVLASVFVKIRMSVVCALMTWRTLVTSGKSCRILYPSPRPTMALRGDALVERGGRLTASHRASGDGKSWKRSSPCILEL